jgi:toxin secretion/phage lysis holin
MWETAVEYLVDVVRDLLGSWVIKVCGSTIAAVFCGWIGGWDKMVCGLFVLVCVDFGLGFTHGWVDGCLSQSKFRRGLAKFFLYAVTLLAAHTLDEVFNVKAQFFLRIDTRSLLIMYLVTNEMCSILGHLQALGMPLPQGLIQRLKSYRDCTVFAGKSGGKGA